MAQIQFSRAAAQAYLAGREQAKVYSVDPQLAEIPAQFQAEAGEYRQGLSDEQQGKPIDPRLTAAAYGGAPAPVPQPSTAPAAVPSAPVGAPKPGSRGSQRLQQYRAFYASLVKLPVEALRATAQRQIALIDDAYRSAPRVKQLEWLRPDYAGARRDLEGARQRFQEGEALAGRADAASLAQRRTEYRRAYNSAFTAGERLASILEDESFLVLVASEVVAPAIQKAAEIGEAAVKTTLDVAGQVGRTTQYIAYGLAAAAGIALIAYGTQRGKRR